MQETSLPWKQNKMESGACAFYQNQTNWRYKHSVASEIAGCFEDRCLFFNVSVFKKKKNKEGEQISIGQVWGGSRAGGGEAVGGESAETLCPGLAH